MTGRPTEPGRDALFAEAQALEAEVRRLAGPGSGEDHRAEIERRVVELCAAAQALPGAEARSLAEPLARLIAALDEAAELLRAAGTGDLAGGDSGPDAGTARRAAAAYGSAASRRRRGF
ncbi:hypothetical protein GCM10017083_47820 [Thalassobaculum fulvum]|uniref:Uncharacterized protein n=1 Tax=Thalassobaculum fulvum TaxID=1633335 RepID=A0A918XWC9_9PROT|nr:hypothetical protein [Thalassobaculum fulvum]GHD61010.1 hypothetical protein GCM10017083_47820 [Thalassobaculum fulvum]